MIGNSQILRSKAYNNIRFNSFTYGAGLHTEIRLTNYNTPNAYGTTTFGYVSLTLEGGYNKITRFKDEYTKGDTPYFIAALVFGLGEF